MSTKVINLARQAMKVLTTGNGFDRIAAPVEIVAAATTGNLKFQWTVKDEQLNGMRTMHGGFTAYMVDFSTTAALMLMGNNKPGVSVDLSVSYMSAAKPGEVVTMETECKKLGARLAFMEATLKDSNGKLLATGKHTKFIG